jgi:thioredoxin-dependent peroxiredoxin
MQKLAEGQKIPKFSSQNQNGDSIKSDDFIGQKHILFFYPQDNTPTCTVESCNLRDNYTALKKLGFKIVGVSADSTKKHQSFIQKFDLPFHLIADTDLEVIKAFGVWGEKTTFGKTYDGIHRTTFVIDEKGIIVKRIDIVKSKDHAQQILNKLNINDQ